MQFITTSFFFRNQVALGIGVLLALAPVGLRAQTVVAPDATFGTAGTASTGLEGNAQVMSSTTLSQFFPNRMGQVVRVGNRLLVAGFSPNSSYFVVKGLTLNGQVDATFGTNGVLTVPLANSECRALAVQPDGKVVAAGATTLIADVPVFVRFSANGVLDASFGTGGVLTASMGTFPNSGITRVAVLPDGRLVGLALPSTTAGSGSSLLYRITATGQFDNTYNGTTPYTILNGYLLRQLRAQPDGRLLLAGVGPLLNGNTKRPAAVLRLTADGLPDASFGTGGTALLNATQMTNSVTTPADTDAFDVDVQPTTGKVVVAGRVHYDASRSAGNSPVLLRFNADGTPDAAFNAAASQLLPSTGGFQALAAQPNGTLVVGGNYQPLSGRPSQPLLARYTTAGQLDASFNPNGDVPAGAYVRSLTSNSNYATVSSLLVDPAGSILTLGGFELLPGQNSATGLLLSRYTASATLGARANAAVLGLEAGPVPATETVQLRYTLPGAAPVVAQVYDLLGRAVGRPLAASWQAAGPQALALDVQGLAPGIYTCVLDAGAWHQGVRLVVAP